MPRPTHPRLHLLPVVLTLALALSACGGGADDEARTAFIDGATAGGSQLSEEQAGCIYDAVSEDLDADQIDGIDLTGGDPDDPAVAEALFTAAQSCLGS